MIQQKHTTINDFLDSKMSIEKLNQQQSTLVCVKVSNLQTPKSLPTHNNYFECYGHTISLKLIFGLVGRKSIFQTIDNYYRYNHLNNNV